MKRFKNIVNQRGSAMIVALMVLLLGSLIAVSSTTISKTESRVSSNEKAYTTAFYEADAGIAPGVQVLLESFANRSVTTYGALPWLTTAEDGEASDTTADNLLDEIIGSAAKTDPARGFKFRTASANNPMQTKVRIKRQGATTSSTGGSTEFGSGGEGVGYGSSGGVHILYWIRPNAVDTVNNTCVAIEANYRKVSRIGEGR